MSEQLTIMAAPLQGYTDAAWRHFHAEIYGNIDTYFTPFMRVERGEVRMRDIRGITSQLNENHTLVPQIIFRDTDEFEMLVDAVVAEGYDRVDLNLGCPFPPQVKHGRGAALIVNSGLLKAIGEIMSAKYPDVVFSVKMRIGVTHSDEWKNIISELNDITLSHITIHPRIASQQYAGSLDMEQFAKFMSESVHPIIYNGDLLSIDDVDSMIVKYPRLSGVMIGRGLLMRPSLSAELKSGKEWDSTSRLDHIMMFHKSLFDYYSKALCGEAQILAKIKPFWEYLEQEIGRKTAKVIKKSTSVNKYLSAVSLI